MVIRSEKPEWLERIGIVAPRRILQVHLDYVFMGLILIGVGTVNPDMPGVLFAALVFGTLVNPFLFIPLMFNPATEKRPWYRALSVTSFLALSISLVAAAVLGPG